MDSKKLAFNVVLCVKKKEDDGFPVTFVGLTAWLEKNGFVFVSPAGVGGPLVVDIEI